MPVTQRDQIWQAAIELREAVEDDERRESLGLTNRYGIPGFTPEDVRERAGDDVAIRTVRDCLNAMTTLGVLAKRTSRPTRYRAPKGANERSERAGAATAPTTGDVDDVEDEAGAVDGEPVDEDSGISVAVDVEGDAGEQAPPASDPVDVEALDLAGSGSVLEARQAAVRACYEYVRENGGTRPKELKTDVIDADELKYKMDTEWRRIRDGLQQLAEDVEDFEAPGEGEKVYRWAGE